MLGAMIPQDDAGYILALIAIGMYSLFKRMQVAHLRSQMDFWLKEREKELRNHEDQVKAAMERRHPVFPIGRTLPEGLQPLPSKGFIKLNKEE